MTRIALALAVAILALTAHSACGAGTQQQEVSKKVVLEFYEKGLF